uniref:Uncharacterized protein n=1 Tax=Candidatus Kentrum sp. DK TaxID=2126562 RepID=A0A450TFS9_9GAMM|nr:MAG: hypothetical protein BECKDK2373C_GA0170839_11396 [Candidatus Kentron sp. DK]
MPTPDFSQAHSPWTNLGEVLEHVSQNPSAAFNAAFLRACEIRDELLALAKELDVPVDARIAAAHRFDPHQYTKIFPFDPKQWREENHERYKAYRKRLDDWIEAEKSGPERGPAAELRLFGEHLDLLALHHQLGKEIISRQELMDEVFRPYTFLRKAADRLPEIAKWSRRLVDVLNATVLRWYGGVLVLVLVLIAILILGLFQWRGVAKIQEGLRDDIQQGIADTREDAHRAVTEAKDVASRFAALRQRFDEVEQGHRIAAMENQLAGLQEETMRLGKIMEDYPRTIQKSEERLTAVDQRVQELEGTVGKQVVIREPSPPTPAPPREWQSEIVRRESEPPTTMPMTTYDPGRSRPTLLQQSDATQKLLEEVLARQGLMENALRSSEKEFIRIGESSAELNKALKDLHDGR